MWLIDQTVDLAQGGRAADKRQALNPLAYPGAANAHQWRVTVLDGGEAANLAGCSASAYFIRVDGSRVAQNGTISGNTANITFPSEVYAYPGLVTAVMEIAKTGAFTAQISAITFTVKDKPNGSVIDPSGEITADVAQLIANIETAVDSIPDDYSALNRYAHALGSMTSGQEFGGTFTAGRIDKSSGPEASNKYAYSELFARTGTALVWDDQTYTVTFCYYASSSADPGTDTRATLTSWYTVSPQVVPSQGSYPYVSAEFKRIDGGNITAADCHLYVKADIVQAVEPLIPVYVDASAANSGDGSSAAPFQTIAEAIATGAESVFVAAGTYGTFSVSDRTRPLRIALWSMGTYTKGDKDVGKIVVSFSGTENGIVMRNCADVQMSDVEVVGSNADTNGYCYRLENIKHLEMDRCYAHDNTVVTAGTPPAVTKTERSGFALNNCNAVLRDCMAYNIGLDGFNIHGFGDTQFINCVAYDCGDDGISHHDACTGLILGGEYYRCGKAGVASPYYDARVDVINVYSHDNLYGIYSAGDDKDGVVRIPAGRLTGCVLKNNATKDVYLSRGTYTAWGNLYDTLQTAQGATLTEIDIAATDDGNGNITLM